MSPNYFNMPECAKATQNFNYCGVGPRTPAFRGRGKGKGEGEDGRRKGMSWREEQNGRDRGGNRRVGEGGAPKTKIYHYATGRYT